MCLLTTISLSFIFVHVMRTIMDRSKEVCSYHNLSIFYLCTLGRNPEIRLLTTISLSFIFVHLPASSPQSFAGASYHNLSIFYLCTHPEFQEWLAIHDTYHNLSIFYLCTRRNFKSLLLNELHRTMRAVPQIVDQTKYFDSSKLPKLLVSFKLWYSRGYGQKESTYPLESKDRETY